MSIDELVTAAVARLAAVITGYAIEAFPDDPKKYRFIHPNGALLVRYSGSRYPEGGVEALDSLVVQDRYIGLEVRVVSRRLNGPLGAGAYLDSVRAALTGWRPPDCHKCYVLDEGFDSYNDKELTWQHHIEFEAKSLLVELTEDETAALLNRVTIHTGDRTTVINQAEG